MAAGGGPGVPELGGASGATCGGRRNGPSTCKGADRLEDEDRVTRLGGRLDGGILAGPGALFVILFWIRSGESSQTTARPRTYSGEKRQVSAATIFSTNIGFVSLLTTPMR